VESPVDVAEVARIARIEGSAQEDEVRVLVPAQIGFLDRWASDVEGARERAQQHLVATVAALAKAGIAAEARVGDEDVVQAVEDQLQSYPATEVVLVSGAARGEAGDREVVDELSSRLRADFHHVRLSSGGREQRS
jgi:predicted TIM-barrel enzyme